MFVQCYLTCNRKAIDSQTNVSTLAIYQDMLGHANSTLAVNSGHSQGGKLRFSSLWFMNSTVFHLQQTQRLVRTGFISPHNRAAPLPPYGCGVQSLPDAGKRRQQLCTETASCCLRRADAIAAASGRQLTAPDVGRREYMRAVLSVHPHNTCTEWEGENPPTVTFGH